MGNSESAEEESFDAKMDEGEEVIRVFQPQKLRQELENGKSF